MVKGKNKIELKGSTVSELERALDKALEWFYAYPEKDFTQNDIQKNLGISKTTAKIVITQLEKEGFLHHEVLGKVWRVQANLSHPLFITHKIPSNLQHIYKSGIVDWINSTVPNPRCISLYGSYRKGEDLSDSDIDIAVETLDDKPIILQEITIPHMGYRKNVNANILIFCRKRIDLNLFANIANGIVLQGFLEVRI